MNDELLSTDEVLDITVVAAGNNTVSHANRPNVNLVASVPINDAEVSSTKIPLDINVFTEEETTKRKAEKTTVSIHASLNDSILHHNTNVNSNSVSLSTNRNNAGGSETAHQPRRKSLAANKHRKKSRKLTLTQVCSEEAAISSPKVQPDSSTTADNDRISNSSSLMSFDSVNSRSSTSSTSSSLKTGPERKINRIFSMLQSMQQTFLQAQPIQHQQEHLRTAEQQQPITPRDQHDEIQEQPPSTIIPSSNSVNYTVLHSEACKIHNSMQQRQQLQLDLGQQQSQQALSSRKLLYSLGRSQDSLMSSVGAGSIAKTSSVSERSRRLGSINSWAGSQCSAFTCTTVMSEGPPPPLVYAMPYHKDGWTSLFIVGSSTYAQLLIVICIVAALSEVVTHNVSFIYFEVFFAFLYTMSILFFLYVFGYLLRSKRKKKEKRRLRKLSKWRESNMANNQSSEDESGSYNRVSHNASISLENEVSMSPSKTSFNRFINSINGYRRRFSRSDSATDMREESSRSVSQNPLPQHNKNLEWTANSAANFNTVDESPSEASHQSHTFTLKSDDNVTGTGDVSNGRKTKKMKVSDNEHSHGSFFLRVGAVAFGLGTMIYDGLEFGAFLEVPPDSPCFSLLRGLNPMLHAAFVFLQMYFIFISARLNIHKFKAVARFGLMHCLATNVAVWVRTLVRESLKEINGHYPYYQNQQPSASLTKGADGYTTSTSVSDAFLQQMAEVVAAVANEEGGSSFELTNETLTEVVSAAVKSKKIMSLWELTGNVSCGRRIFLGDLIMDAAPFLYPFLIEYSLIGAAVLYVVWAHIGLNPKYKTEENRNNDSIWNSKTRQLRVDCVGASKGLFIGLIFLTATLLCLVLFFIFTPQPQYHRLGLFLADAAHCTLLVVSTFAMFYGVYRARHLHFHSDHMEELGSILLRVSALGIFAYSVFSMIAGALDNTSTHESPMLVFINGLLSIIEVTVQTVFISDMSRRSVNTPEQDREKPGRQAVTFLLITNMALWMIYTFEMQKVEANPVQLNFYGFLPWAIVQRITLPLCIFYRFHSAIVYAEIWKNSYRFHGDASSREEVASQSASQSVILAN